MMQSSTLKTSSFSHLASASILNPQGERHSKSIFADLLLTALIDAFSILVIFLLMSFSSSGELLTLKGMELPKAVLGQTLERNPVVKLENDKIFLEDKQVTADELVAGLLELRKQFAATHPGVEYPGILTIQADRRVKYEQLNSIVVATGNAGFSDIKFAVLMQ